VTIRRLLGAALIVPAIVGALLLVTGGPAAACSYPSAPIRVSEAQYAARADAVFVGELVSWVARIDWAARAARTELAREFGTRPRADRVRELMGKLRRSSDRTVWTLEVRRVYKGAVGERQEVITPIEWGMGGCGPGLQLRGAGPFLVFADRPSPDMSRRYQLEPGQYVLSAGSRPLANGGAPALGEPPGWWPGGPDSWPPPASVGALATGVAAGLGLANLRARRRASAD
jgi:hypothetical protein